jgi:hypothetical protein
MAKRLIAIPPMMAGMIFPRVGPVNPMSPLWRSGLAFGVSWLPSAWSEQLQLCVKMLPGDHQKCTSHQKIAFGRSISGITRVIPTSIPLNRDVRYGSKLVRTRSA